MATERINIVVTERGSRVVKRNLSEVGTASRRAAGGVNFLRNALVGLGAALGVREITRFLDASTQLQNRLRAVGLEGRALEATYRELLGTANSTRSSFEGTVELFSRLAISSKELGVSQSQLIDFTKSLNQAIILSGASATEAQAGLIQLSQGMASGTLRGDELRSVLEQLPAVADVIAKELGVTRGELRKMGEDGKISADVILDAFKSSRVELEERFGTTASTIAESFAILKNQIIEAGRVFDEAFGAGQTIASGITAIAMSLGEIAQALVVLTKVAIAAGAAMATLYAAQKIKMITSAIGAWIEYRRAIASGTAVVLGSAEAERQKASATLSSAVADANAAGSALRAAQAENALAAAKVRGTQATLAQLRAERSLETARLAAQISATGRMRSLNRIAEIRRAEMGINKTLQTQQAALAASSAAVASADRARSASLDQVTAAQARNAAATRAAAGSTTLLGQAVTYLRNALMSLWVVIAANPVTALAVVLAAATTALFLFRDQINLGVDDITTLGDLMRAFGEEVTAALRQVRTAAQATFGPLMDLIGDWVGEVEFSVIGVLRLTARGVDSYYGLWAGALNAVIALFRALPAAIGDLMTQAMNLQLRIIGNFVNKAGELLSSITEFVGLGEIAAIELQIDNKYAGSGKQLGKEVGDAFNEGFNSVTFASDFLEKITDRAQEIAKAREEAQGDGKGGDLGQDLASSGVDGDAAKKIQDLRKEMEQLIASYNGVYAAQLQYKEAVDILTRAEEENLITGERKGEVLGLIRKQLEDALDPYAALNREMDRELEMLQLTSSAREIETQLRSIEQDLLGQGIILNEQELAQMRERLTLLQEEEAAASARESTYNSIMRTMEMVGERQRALNELFDAGRISIQQYTEAMRELAVLATQDDNSWIGGMENGLRRVAEQANDLGDGVSDVVVGAFDKAENAIVQFAKTGEVNIRQLFSSIAEELMRLATQQLFAQFLGMAMGGMGGGGAAIAGGFTSQIPGFKTGGSFEVGGSGGEDSQLVAFRASPGERVDISTRGQQKDQERAPNVTVPPAQIKVVNVTDPRESLAALDTAEGEQVIMNAIERNPSTIQRLLGAN